MSQLPLVVLRDVVDADLPIFFKHQLEPAAIAMAAFASRDQLAFDIHWAKIRRDKTSIIQTIEANGLVAGNIVCFGAEERRLVGYWLGQAFWGQGIATQALAAFLLHVTSRPLYAYVAHSNPGSLRVLEKCGFTIRSEDFGAPDAQGNPVKEFFLQLG